MRRSRGRWLGWTAVAFLVGAAAGSCNPAEETPPCGVGSCDGCCIDGICAVGVPDVCGLGGVECFVCGAGAPCVAGACVVASTCGNGAVEIGEECDDGNVAGGDGCDASCRTEIPAADADADADAVEDEVEECGPYPLGPYAFQRVGDTLAPMWWSAGRSGPDEELATDLMAIRCAPGVKSIFLFVATTTCSVCPARLREVNRLKDHWIATGAKWIFLVTDAGSSPMASLYIDRYGISFGWRSNDMDNSEGRFAIAQATEFVPWIAAVRASDMTIRYLETSTSRIDIEAVATTLAAD